MTSRTSETDGETQKEECTRNIASITINIKERKLLLSDKVTNYK